MEKAKRNQELSRSHMYYSLCFLIFLKLQWKFYCWWKAGLGEKFGLLCQEYILFLCLWSNFVDMPAPMIKHIEECLFCALNAIELIINSFLIAAEYLNWFNVKLIFTFYSSWSYECLPWFVMLEWVTSLLPYLLASICFTFTHGEPWRPKLHMVFCGLWIICFLLAIRDH